MANITIEVAYALPAKQYLLSLSVEAGTCALDAVKASKIDQMIPHLDIENATLGIFSQIISHDYPLKAGDRIEIYRPLIRDPKLSRSEKANQKRGRKWRAKH